MRLAQVIIEHSFDLYKINLDAGASQKRGEVLLPASGRGESRIEHCPKFRTYPLMPWFLKHLTLSRHQRQKDAAIGDAWFWLLVYGGWLIT
jgi:hypothetical protein